MLNGSKILIIAPHADDEVLGCGGMISKCNDTCHIQVLVIANRSDSNNKNLKNEQILQSKKIQDEHHIHYNFFDYKDELIDTIPITEIIKKIELLNSAFLPDYVFIPNIGDINNDHKVIHNACLIAFRKIQKNQPKKLISYEVPSSTTQGEPFHPNLYIELSEKNVDDKIKMLYVYSDELRPEPNPRNARGITVYSEFRGMECNKQYAEAFKVIYEIN